MDVHRKTSETTADAIRVEVVRRSGKEEVAGSAVTTLDLQVRKVLEVAPVSPSLAVVIAVLAFASGRRP